MSEEQLTMADMEAEINASMIKYCEGDRVKGMISNIEDMLVYVDLGTFMQGIIIPTELSDDPDFNSMRDLKIGDEITAVVLSTDDGKGNLVLSRKEAVNDIAWENLETGKAEGTLYPVKISKSVNGGFIAFVNGIRGFIPISRLSLRRIEEDEKEQYVGTTVEVVIIDLNKEKNSLVLSAREQEEKKAQEEKAKRFSAVSVGMVSKGTVESIMPYGCFVNLGEGLSGLVHISQIAHKRLKTPNEEVKIGQEVDVKVIDIKDGKISLSMKALVDFMEKNEEIDEGPCEYSSGEEATTTMGSLLAGFKLD